MLDEKGDAMKKILMALAAVATLAVSSVAAPAPAHAQRGIGAAIAGGIIGGAIVGGALAGPRYYGPGYYGPGYGYYGDPAYVADDYYGGCGWQRQRFWDGYCWGVCNRGVVRLSPVLFGYKKPPPPRNRGFWYWCFSPPAKNPLFKG